MATELLIAQILTARLFSSVIHVLVPGSALTKSAPLACAVSTTTCGQSEDLESTGFGSIVRGEGQ